VDKEKKFSLTLGYAGTGATFYDVLTLPFPPSLLGLFQVISQNEADYFFDSLRQVTDWNRRNKPGKDGKEHDKKLHEMLCSTGVAAHLSSRIYSILGSV